MLVQISILLVLVPVVHFVSIKVAANKLGGDEEAAKLGSGIAKILLGFFMFAIAGEDVILLERWSDEIEIVDIVYVLVRYGFLLMALFGIIQSFASLYEKAEKKTEATDHWEQMKSAASDYQSIPAWKRVEMEKAGQKQE